VRLNGRLEVGDNPSTWMPRAAFITADPPKVVPLAQQPSFVRVARYPTAFGKRLFCECLKPWQESVRQTNRMRLIGPILKASGNCRKIVTMA